jgi:hypothetical protein
MRTNGEEGEEGGQEGQKGEEAVATARRQIEGRPKSPPFCCTDTADFVSDDADALSTDSRDYGIPIHKDSHRHRGTGDRTPEVERAWHCADVPGALL